MVQKAASEEEFELGIREGAFRDKDPGIRSLIYRQKSNKNNTSDQRLDERFALREKELQFCPEYKFLGRRQHHLLFPPATRAFVEHQQ